ncbi:hypothetical protein FA15DRAFT_757558 [Coprinopsis marcescibilis]|uniref:PH domain-containing protein n=1 Tax=Coprinopsis marcescibilis TaxID=230819 RepID=A0A5C3KS44_COPMA|nr:hypothetical protein FA15DRAFT_757558 [Coprinopsis marcescibilis]
MDSWVNNPHRLAVNNHYPFALTLEQKSAAGHPDSVFVRDPPRDTLPTSQFESWGQSLDSPLAFLHNESAEFLLETVSAVHFYQNLHNISTGGSKPNDYAMVRRGSIQFLQSLLPLSPATSTNSGDQTPRSRANSRSSVAGTSKANTPRSPAELQFPAIPIPSTSSASTAGTSSSPPLDFLLDDDPFANLTSLTPIVSRVNASTPTAPPPPEIVSLNPPPRSPLMPLIDEVPKKSLVRADSAEALPTARQRAFSIARSPKPAYRRPAFQSRPSLPSLNTLAQMNVVLTKKVRKGRVGAGLPFEPWDNTPDSDMPTRVLQDVESKETESLPVGTQPLLPSQLLQMSSAAPGAQQIGSQYSHVDIASSGSASSSDTFSSRSAYSPLPRNPDTSGTDPLDNIKPKATIPSYPGQHNFLDHLYADTRISGDEYDDGFEVRPPPPALEGNSAYFHHQDQERQATASELDIHTHTTTTNTIFGVSTTSTTATTSGLVTIPSQSRPATTASASSASTHDEPSPPASSRVSIDLGPSSPVATSSSSLSRSVSNSSNSSASSYGALELGARSYHEEHGIPSSGSGSASGSVLCTPSSSYSALSRSSSNSNSNYCNRYPRHARLPPPTIPLPPPPTPASPNGNIPLHPSYSSSSSVSASPSTRYEDFHHYAGTPLTNRTRSSSEESEPLRSPRDAEYQPFGFVSTSYFPPYPSCSNISVTGVDRVASWRNGFGSSSSRATYLSDLELGDPFGVESPLIGGEEDGLGGVGGVKPVKFALKRPHPNARSRSRSSFGDGVLEEGGLDDDPFLVNHRPFQTRAYGDGQDCYESPVSGGFGARSRSSTHSSGGRNHLGVGLGVGSGVGSCPSSADTVRPRVVCGGMGWGSGDGEGESGPWMGVGERGREAVFEGGNSEDVEGGREGWCAGFSSAAKSGEEGDCVDGPGLSCENELEWGEQGDLERGGHQLEPLGQELQLGPFSDGPQHQYHRQSELQRERVEVEQGEEEEARREREERERLALLDRTVMSPPPLMMAGVANSMLNLNFDDGCAMQANLNSNMNVQQRLRGEYRGPGGGYGHGFGAFGESVDASGGGGGEYRSRSQHANGQNGANSNVNASNTFSSAYYNGGSGGRGVNGWGRGDDEDDDRRRQPNRQMYNGHAISGTTTSSSAVSEDEDEDERRDSSDSTDDYGRSPLSSAGARPVPGRARSRSSGSRAKGSFVPTSPTTASRPQFPPMPTSSRASRASGVVGTSTATTDDEDDDDVPLAQRIPTALKAQKSIRKQVRRERDERRAARQERGDVGYGEGVPGEREWERERHTTLRPAGAGGPFIPPLGMSSSQDAAMHAVAAAGMSGGGVAVPVSRHVSQRHPSQPGVVSPNGFAFSPDDLAKRLQSVQVQLVDGTPPPYSTGVSISPDKAYAVGHSRGRSVKDATAGSPPSPLVNPVKTGGAPLRSARSFHHAERRPFAEEHHSHHQHSASHNHAQGHVQPTHGVPLPVDAEQRIATASLSRRGTTATRSQSRPRGESVGAHGQSEPSAVMRNRSLSVSRNGQGHSSSHASGHHNQHPHHQYDEFGAPPPPVPPLPLAFDDVQGYQQQLSRKLTKGGPPPSASAAAAAAMQSASVSGRPSVEAERRPSLSGKSPGGVAAPLPSGDRGQVVQQRIFIGDMQRFNMVEISATTTAGDVVETIEAQGNVKNIIGVGGWMLWEVAQDFGMERPIRSFELLADVQASWNKDKMVNLFVMKMTPLAVPLNRNAIPSSSPRHGGYVEWESKRGKWSKRWMELREHSIWLSKRENSKDEVFLCSLSNFDAFHINRTHRAPKAFAFSVKSTDNLSYFENAADYLHTFSCSEKDGKMWMEKILVARSYVLHQERQVLFNPKAAGGNGAGALSRSGTKKSASRPAPLVSVPPPFSAKPVSSGGAVFEPGSLLHGQL